MFTLPSFRAPLARVAALAAAALVLSLGVTLVPGAESRAAAADSPECACAEVGAFSEPNPGVAPAYTLVTPDLATSPRGGYELVREGSVVTIHRAGDRTRALVTLPTVGSDRRWGFSPDDDRFLTWTLGAGQLITWQLYNLAGTNPGTPIRDVQGIAASSVNFAFSRGGQRLIVGAVSGGAEQEVSVYTARTGAHAFTTRAPISFPAYDPGAGSDPGGPSAPRNVKAVIPKKTSFIDISWDDPLYQGDGAIARYELTVDPIPPTESVRTDLGARHVRLTGYRPGVKYAFELRIVNRWGKKSPAVTVTAKLPFPEPVPTPTPTPTIRPLVPEPTASTIPEPTFSPEPVPEPTVSPEPEPTVSPAPEPTVSPSPEPAPEPTVSPTPEPERAPEPEPAASPESETPETLPSHDPTAPALAPVSSGTRDDAVPATASATRAVLASFRTTSTDVSSPTTDIDATPLAAGDTGGWGFSPDEDARYVLISTVVGGRPSVTMYDAETGKTAFRREITSPSARWSFSPCAGAFGIVQLSTSFDAEYTLVNTATGKQIATAAAEAKKSYGFTVQQSGENFFYYYWADGTGRVLAPIADCGPPPPPPPTAPTDVSATAAIGRVTVSWKHSATDLQEFEVTPIVAGAAQKPIVVDGRARTVVLGAGDDLLAAGSYRFQVAARGAGGRSAESALSAGVRVSAASVCGAASWTKGAVSGSAEGAPTSDGVRAAFSYTVSGLGVTFRTSSSPSNPASVLDAGWGRATAYPAGAGSRTSYVTYPMWGDYLASVTATGKDGATSVATAIIHIAPQDPPANDAYAKAAALTGRSGVFDAETRWTSCESGEPGGAAATLTQWFTFRAPADGTLVISDGYQQVNAYAGDSWSALVPTGERYTKLPYSDLYVPVTQGRTVSLQVLAGAGSNGPRTFDGRWRFAVRPTNDDIAQATVIDTAIGASLEGDLTAAGVEPDEPAAPGSCEECESDLAASTWYRWTAASDAYAWFRAPVHGIGLDIFAADAAAPTALTPVTPSVKSKRGEIGLRQEPGRTYYLRASVEVLRVPLMVDLDYTIGVIPSPANDFVRDAVPIGAATGHVAGSSLGGYVEAIPAQAADAGWRSSMVWYEWTAPEDGGVSFAVEAARDQIAQPEALVFLPGDGAGDPTRIAPATLPRPETWRSSQAAFVAEKGRRYLVAVTGIWTDAYSGATEGDFVLSWDPARVPGPPTDLTATANPRAGAVELDWSLEDDGDADVLGYRVSAEPALPDGAVVDVNVRGRHATLRGLEAGVAYELRLSAVNAVGAGADSAPVTAIGVAGLSVDALRIVAAPGEAFTAALTARGGSEPYAYSLDGAPDGVEVDESTGVITGSAPGEAGPVRFVAIVRDAEGATARRGVLLQVGEPAAPPIEADVPEAPGDGWYDDDVTVLLEGIEAADAPVEDGAAVRATTGRASGVRASAGAAATVPITWRLTGAQEGSGSSAGRAEITVRAEGETVLRYWSDDSTVAKTLTIRVDRTAPTVTVSAPVEGATYATDPVPAFACADTVSGVVRCELAEPHESHAAIGEERSIGIRATDRAGNVALVTRSYRVVAAGPVDPVDPGSPGDPVVPDRDAAAGAAGSRGLPRTGADSSAIGGLLAVGVIAVLVGAAVLRRPVRRRG